ncbi:hypothetical protein F4806DRAFT_469655 [Annulohypoxylon nitens]|nr:hypothetical protein F4806DRAFT_469655 [Annulohypoxylon nitens]
MYSTDNSSENPFKTRNQSKPMDFVNGSGPSRRRESQRTVNFARHTRRPVSRKRESTNTNANRGSNQPYMANRHYDQGPGSDYGSQSQLQVQPRRTKPVPIIEEFEQNDPLFVIDECDSIQGNYGNYTSENSSYPGGEMDNIDPPEEVRQRRIPPLSDNIHSRDKHLYKNPVYRDNPNPMMTRPPPSYARRRNSDLDARYAHHPRVKRLTDAEKREEELRANEEIRQRETAEKTRFRRLLREIEAEDKANAQAREVRATLSEETVKLSQAQLDQNIGKIIELIKEKLEHEIRTDRQSNTEEQARQDQLQGEVQDNAGETERTGLAKDIEEMNESGERGEKKEQEATEQEAQLLPPDSQQRLPRRPSMSPVLRANSPHKPLSPQSNEPPPRPPPTVPDPPNADSDAESERQTVLSSPSEKLRQEEHSQERKERMRLRLIREELVFPITEILAELTRAAYQYAPPMPPPFRRHGAPRPYRRYDEDFGGSHSESESDDAMDNHSESAQDQSRGRQPRRSIERDGHEVYLSSPAHKPHLESDAEEASSTKEIRLLEEEKPESTQINAKVEQETLEKSALGKSIENDTGDLFEVKTTFGLIKFNVTFLLILLSSVLLLFMVLSLSSYIIWRLFM